MSDQKQHPITALISRLTRYFADESLRLKDKSVLVEYEALIESLFSVLRQLGTLAHEVALASLSDEYEKARLEAKQAWREIWVRFQKQRSSAKETENTFLELNAEIETLNKEVSNFGSPNEPGHDEGAESIRDLLDLIKQASDASKPLSKDRRKVPWVMLWADLRNYSVYIQYFATRVFFAALRHTFIIIVGILIFGVAYSKVASHSVGAFVTIADAWPWLAGLLIFGAYILRKYYFEPKFKRLQVRLESRWLPKVAIRLHMVRALALMSRTRSRKTAA